MRIPMPVYLTRARAGVAVAGLLVALAGCSVPGPGEAPDGIYDPREASNRRIHAFNKSLAGGAGQGGGVIAAIPQPVKAGVTNFADTVSLPQTVANQILQGRLLRASRNTLRFTVNATLGLAGLFDVAGPLGLPEDESDFGETLYVWGFPEGAYLELPVLGPSTERDAVGRFVDLFTDPLYYLLPSPDRYYGTGARVAAKVIQLDDYGDQIDALMKDSADSYAQLRLIWLQNRRFDLGDDRAGGEDYIDPEALDTEGF